MKNYGGRGLVPSAAELSPNGVPGRHALHIHHNNKRFSQISLSMLAYLHNNNYPQPIGGDS